MPSVVQSSIRLFADVCVVFRVIDNDCVRLTLQNDLDQVEGWCRSNSIELNHSKSNLVRFSCRNLVSQGLWSWSHKIEFLTPTLTRTKQYPFGAKFSKYIKKKSNIKFKKYQKWSRIRWNLKKKAKIKIKFKKMKNIHLDSIPRLKSHQLQLIYTNI